MEKAKKSHRAHGRRTKAVPADPQKEHEETLRAFLKTFTHFFGPFGKRFGSLPDPRQPEKPEDVGYSVCSLVFLGIAMYACMAKSRRQVRFTLFTVFLVDSFKTLFDAGSVPHGDTMNGVRIALPFDGVQEIVSGMVETRIDKRVLEHQRIFERYYVVAIDATCLQVYPERHCPHCLAKTHNGKTRYYHYALEAKLVTPYGFAFSILTEFVENADVIAPNVSVTADNVVALANEGGRLRWKIENEGFNAQKKSGYNLEHAYTNDYNGMKIYHLLLQVAHLIMQLLMQGSLLRKTFP